MSDLREFAEYMGRIVSTVEPDGVQSDDYWRGAHDAADSIVRRAFVWADRAETAEGDWQLPDPDQDRTGEDVG